MKETEESKVCDPVTKPAETPIPNGYSNRAYVRCNNGVWEWYDPQVAE